MARLHEYTNNNRNIQKNINIMKGYLLFILKTFHTFNIKKIKNTLRIINNVNANQTFIQKS